MGRLLSEHILAHHVQAQPLLEEREGAVWPADNDGDYTAHNEGTLASRAIVRI